MDKYNEVAGEKFNTINPYQDENDKRRKLNPEIYLKKSKMRGRRYRNKHGSMINAS